MHIDTLSAFFYTCPYITGEPEMNYYDFLKWTLRRIRNRYKDLKQWYRLEKTLDPSVTFEKDVLVKKRQNLFLGKDIHISRGVILDCGGSRWCDYRGKITIGDHVYISYNAILLGAGEIEIGKGAKIGNQSLITSYTPDGKILGKNRKLVEQSITPHEFKKVTIGERAFIGAGCTILMGVTIGHDAVISPGTVIRHNVEPFSFVFPNTRLNSRSYQPKH